MLRLFVVALPLLVAVGVLLAESKLPLDGSDRQRFAKVLGGAVAVGLLCSGITCWQQNRMADQVEQARQAAASGGAAATWQGEQSKLYEQKISSLQAQVTDLQSQLAKRPENPQTTAVDAAVKQQSAVLPKIYWTQADEAGGGTAVRFKTYGPVNIPAFIAICDRPCKATHGEIGSGSAGTQVVGTTAKMAGYIFSKPRPIQAGTEGFVIIEPGTSKVEEFRILGNSEIPPALR
jgi:hypothetical protein